jgi:excisionase family DNA binding protein
MTRPDAVPPDRLLTPAEVAALFRVDPKTVTRWAQQGKLHSIRTLGGHRRYPEAEILAFLAAARQLPHPVRDRGLAACRPAHRAGPGIGARHACFR